MANELKMVFGTPQTVLNTATDIASGNFSGAPTEFNNTNDAVVPYAPYARAVLQAPDWGAAPTANSAITLWAIQKDVDGTSDCTGAPSGTAVNGATLVGSFKLYATDELQRRAIIISLLGVSKIDYYLRNDSGQNMNNDAGTNCTLIITPFTLGPV